MHQTYFPIVHTSGIISIFPIRDAGQSKSISLEEPNLSLLQNVNFAKFMSGDG